jgi:hypothetical protein
MVKLALRDSKTATRPYLLVNPLLAKHIPAEPAAALEYFAKLGRKVNKVCGERNCLVIGFAETATAVGVAVASEIANAVYVHTTREAVTGAELVTEFSEEHSHAKNQALYLLGGTTRLTQFDTLVFVEDEVTTGTTILNFLRSVDWKRNVVISAWIFNEFNDEVFADFDAEFVCLEKINAQAVTYINEDGFKNPRIGVAANEYQACCRRLADRLIYGIDGIDLADIDGCNVLVIGTEEFMYPAVYLARRFAKTAQSVKTHSTTRSPILPRPDSEYPLRTRDSFASVYDKERVTYLYNLAKYDTVIVITDAADGDLSELLYVIKSYGNMNIYAVTVRNDG